MAERRKYQLQRGAMTLSKPAQTKKSEIDHERRNHRHPCRRTLRKTTPAAERTSAFVARPVLPVSGESARAVSGCRSGGPQARAGADLTFAGVFFAEWQVRLLCEGRAHP